MKKKKTSDAVKILHDRYYKGNEKRQAALERERVNARLARELYELRTKNNLTQKELARMIKTTPSVISRLENADYSGHSLSLLQRIATALNRKVEIRLVPIPGKRRPTPHLEHQA